MDPKQFGQFISAERAAKGLTQKELAEKLGVTDKAISKWERGVCLPDVAKFDDIAAALGITDVEVLRAHRMPRESAPRGASGLLVTPRELGALLLGCLLLTVPHFALSVLLDMTVPYDPYDPSRAQPLILTFSYTYLRLGLTLAWAVWLALRRTRGETAKPDWRGVLDCLLIFAALFLLYYLTDGGWLLSLYPERIFGIEGVWDESAGQLLREVWYRRYLDGAWTPKLLLFIYVNYELCDSWAFLALLLCLGGYPVAKLLRIWRNHRKQAKEAVA